jgi:ABC-type arginine/histidine transport system permease subunit
LKGYERAAVPRFGSQSFRVYETLIAAGIMHVILTFVLTRDFGLVERRLNRDRLPPEPVLKPRAQAA